MRWYEIEIIPIISNFTVPWLTFDRKKRVRPKKIFGPIVYAENQPEEIKSLSNLSSKLFWWYVFVFYDVSCVSEHILSPSKRWKYKYENRRTNGALDQPQDANKLRNLFLNSGCLMFFFLYSWIQTEWLQSQFPVLHFKFNFCISYSEATKFTLSKFLP